MELPPAPVEMEINPQVAAALEALEGGSSHVFVTGRAGSGKSTLLRHFLDTANLRRTAILAPTGVAALNVGGETIHRFFRFFPGMTMGEVERHARDVAESDSSARVYRRLDAIIIDEISMVRADLLDQMDVFLRIVRGNDLPFGGVRLFMFGDLYQLPPVVVNEEREYFRTHYDSPYFFSAHVFNRLLGPQSESPFSFVELEKIYRQTDPTFIELLNQVRSKELTAEALAAINARVVPPGAPGQMGNPKGIYLTTTNRRAAEINSQRLLELPGRPDIFVAEVSAGFPPSHFPTEERLELKAGARVMLLNNDPAGRWVNGSLGTVLRIDMEAEAALVDLDDGDEVWVERHLWQSSYNYWDEETEEVARESLGYFLQLPLRLAWAVTIHKAQGKTFPELTVDFERAAFAHGQAYVALSRGTSLDGLHLARPLRPSDVRLDRRIVKFLTRTQADLAQGDSGPQAMERTLRDAIDAGTDLEMIYLKSSNQKTRRRITPLAVEDMEYSGVQFRGLRAHCHERRAPRTFRVDQILELKPV